MLVLLAGCAPRAALRPSATPAQAWTPPAPVSVPASPPAVALPSPLALVDAVDLALANSPETRSAWHAARAAAARYGAAQGAWWPTVDGEAAATRGNEATGDWASTASAGLRLGYRLLDFGARGGTVDAARQALIAANWTHGAAINDRVLAVELAYFSHAGALAAHEASASALADAESSLAAAEARHALGLATIADVLQARTAASQARLALQSAAGRVRTSRGALALAMGQPAQSEFAIASGDTLLPALTAEVETVDALIAAALARRPDLQALRAQALAQAAAARAARGALWPSLSLSAGSTRRWLEGTDEPLARESASLVLDLPLFAGLSRRNAARAAALDAEAAAERARGAEQAVAFAVFVAHSDLETAAERLTTSADLLASAEASAAVAAGRYREGVGSVLDLLSAQSALAAARAEAIGARLDWLTAIARLAHAVGALDPRAAGLLDAEAQW